MFSSGARYILLSILAGLLILTSCGEDDGTVMTSQTATLTTTPDPTVPPYINDIRGLADYADQVNSDYRRLVEDFEVDGASREEVIARAGNGSAEFQVMVDRLQEMEVPEEMATAHQKLISGFGKWRSFYDLQVQGLTTGDGNLLVQAMELDSQAVKEVNEAIADMNRGS